MDEHGPFSLDTKQAFTAALIAEFIMAWLDGGNLRRMLMDVFVWLFVFGFVFAVTWGVFHRKRR